MVVAGIAWGQHDRYYDWRAVVCGGFLVDPDHIHEAVYEREGQGSVMPWMVSVSRPEHTEIFNSQVSRLMKVVTSVTE